jgi:hypothetical protein
LGDTKKLLWRNDKNNLIQAHIYELIGDKEHAIVNYLAAARLFEANNYLTEKVECAKRVLELDSTNLDANELLGTNVPR